MKPLLKFVILFLITSCHENEKSLETYISNQRKNGFHFYDNLELFNLNQNEIVDEIEKHKFPIYGLKKINYDILVETIYSKDYSLWLNSNNNSVIFEE